MTINDVNVPYIDGLNNQDRRYWYDKLTKAVPEIKGDPKVIYSMAELFYKRLVNDGRITENDQVFIKDFEVLSGAEVPVDISAPVGSIYIRDTGDIYGKDIEGTWVFRGNLRGPKGDPGDKGEPGTSVQIKGSIENANFLPTSGNILGDGWVTSNDGHLHVWGGTFFSDVGTVKGPKGDKGDSGATAEIATQTSNGLMSFPDKVKLDRATSNLGEQGYLVSRDSNKSFAIPGPVDSNHPTPKSYVDAETLSVLNNAQLVRDGGEGIVYATKYGAPGATVGDGINNDYWTIQRAINAGKEVVLEGGKDYLIAGTLTAPAGRKSVSIRATGAKPARLIIGASGQSYSAIKFEQTVSSAKTTLTANIGVGQHGWTVASTDNILPGMICEVISSALWYFDPRPGEGEGRKSELHKVKDTFLGKVYFEDPANDGYVVSSETVSLEFFVPLQVRLENLEIVGKLPAIAEETNAVIGVEIHHADNPQLINVSTDSCARTGIYINRCYRPVVDGGVSRRSNNYWNGYGVATSGSAHSRIKNRFSYECRRSVDISGSNIISRNTVIENCVAIGGGTNSRGDTYGFLPDGTIGADQSGFGTHGTADESMYINCRTVGIKRPFSFRGRNETLINPYILGRCHGGAIQLSYGTNLWVKGGVVSSGYWGYKSTTLVNGQAAATLRADSLVRTYAEYQTNTPIGVQRGRISIEGISAELKEAVLRLNETTPPPLGRIHIAGDFYFGGLSSTDQPVLIMYEGETNTSSKANWFLGPYRMKNEVSGLPPILATPTLSMVGANVMDYTVKA